MTAQRPPLVPDRIRRIDGSFAFLPHRFLRDGFLASLSPDERSLYLFLVLAADRDGISFYSVARISSTLELDVDGVLHARNGLIEKDLVAYDGHRFQVLSLPPRPRWGSPRALRSAAELEGDDPAAVRQAIRRSLRGDD